ncbi:MAG TPA: adenylate/guanylate cyclase domain-containing protein, partial [Mycobacterium sp.]|nr:adenylate/guanylate cyclase domain-containing protein [Mycobacterium sp.]
AECEADILALWDSPRQREAYTWFTAELANLRTAFRWAADQGDVDVAGAIATYAGFLGIGTANYEPLAWAEELIEPATAIDHPRLATLYLIAASCWAAGRVEAAVRYADDGQMVIASGRHEVPFGAEGLPGLAYFAAGQARRAVEWCRAQLARGRDTHTLTGSATVFALTVAGFREEARAAAAGLIEAAEATRNPYALAYALSAYGFAFRDADPHRARDARLRGLAIAQNSGNRILETTLAAGLSSFEAKHGDPATAFDYLTVAICNYHESGNTSMIRIPLVVLAALFDRLGRHEAAATIAGFAFNPFTAAAVSEIGTAVTHLRMSSATRPTNRSPAWVRP